MEGPEGPEGTLRTRDLPPFSDAAEEARACWQVVVAWHRDPDCIGALFEVEVRHDGSRLDLGRLSPDFEAPDGRRIEIADRFVSREACSIVGEAGVFTLRRCAGSSRLRLNGTVVTAACELHREQLAQGFSLALADQVLLHLRLHEDAQGERSDEIAGADAPSLRRLRGAGRRMRALRQQVRSAARQGGDVLLVGPTGTGKELVARALHELGPRAAGPWVPVNVAAIPEDLAAAAFFGARRGAFTGADAHRSGFFQRAAGGTLFLDEIGDAPASLQPLLLRALQEREVQVLGGRPEKVELGVIAAMERHPDDSGFPFRQALRYRLAAREIHLPPLVERREDTGLLLAHFLDGHGALPKDCSPLAQWQWLRLVDALLVRGWPGNVRELEHFAAELALVVLDGGDRAFASLLQRLEASVQTMSSPAKSEGEAAIDPATVGGSHARRSRSRLAALDEAAFERAWEAADFEVAQLARDLDASRPAVYRRVKQSPNCRLAIDLPLAEILDALDACRGDAIAAARRLRVSRRGLQSRLRALETDPQTRFVDRHWALGSVHEAGPPRRSLSSAADGELGSAGRRRRP